MWLLPTSTISNKLNFDIFLKIRKDISLDSWNPSSTLSFLGCFVLLRNFLFIPFLTINLQHIRFFTHSPLLPLPPCSIIDTLQTRKMVSSIAIN